MSYRDTKVLITGAGGFIGSHLTRRLVNEGADVHAFANSTWRISDILEKVRCLSVDLSDMDKVTEALSDIKPEVVFHLAAKTNVERSEALSEAMVKSNIAGTLNLLDALKGDYRCFVNTGTCEEYGNGPVPFKEDQMPIPVSPYSASKAAVTFFCQMYHRSFGWPIVTLRPFLTYGPSQGTHMLIPHVIESCIKNRDFSMTKGEQTREFNYVDDIVDGFLRAGSERRAIGEIINLGNGKEVKVLDVVTMIVRMIGNPVNPGIGQLPYRPGETMHFYCDSSKAKRLLGWEPKTDIENGLRKTIEWYRGHQHV
jgi:nucleoside-diphosphate-sugar epimerase